MNILFVGSLGVLSLTLLEQLYNSKHTVCAVATNDVSNNEFSAIQAGSLQAFTFDNSISLINLNDSISGVIAQVETIIPDVILVSCYTRLLSQSISSLS